MDPRGGVWTFAATPWVAPNVARILDDGALLIEGTRTNWVVKSEDISSGGWTTLNSPAIVTDVSTAPDGIGLADRITYAVGGSAGQLRQTINSTVDTGMGVYSWWIRRPVATPQDARLYFKDRNNTNNILEEVAFSSTDWVRYIRVIDSGAGATSPIFGLLETNDGSDQGPFELWGAEYQPGAFPASHIRTDSRLLRDGDILSIANGNIDAQFFIGAWSVDVGFEAATAEAPTTQYLFWRDASNYLALVSGSTMRLRVAGDNYDITGLSIARGDELTVEVDWVNNDMTVTGGGGGTVSTSGAWSAGTTKIGSDGTGDHLWGTITPPLALV